MKNKIITLILSISCMILIACNTESVEPVATVESTEYIETVTEVVEATETEETEETEAENTGGVDVKLTEDEYQGDSPYDTEVSEYDGMTPEQIAQQLIADYLKDNAQTGQIHVDIPGATPHDPSQDGTTPDYGAVEVPPDLQGSFH